MGELLTADSVLPFVAGTVRHACEAVGQVRRKGSHIVIEYPSRINAMAIDPSKVAVSCDGCYTPGEILMAVAIPLRLEIDLMDGEGLETDARRESLIWHAKGLIENAVGRRFAMRVKVSGMEIPHCGFGSSGRLLAAVAAGLNTLLGEPIEWPVLQRYMACNHGEEILDSRKMLVPVQCIGGALSSGFNVGGFQVIAGGSRLIASHVMPDTYKVVVAWPTDGYFLDSRLAMGAELVNMDKFYRIGVTHGHEIAYRVLHELLPALQEGDYKSVGEVIEWYRYDLGSNKACSFSHPRMIQLADALRGNKERLGISFCGISSVGPALYAVTQNPRTVYDFLSGLGLRAMSVDFWNERFKVVEID